MKELHKLFPTVKEAVQMSASSYTKALAEAMQQSKERIVANLMEAQWAEREKPYEVEVKFDEQPK